VCFCCVNQSIKTNLYGLVLPYQAKRLAGGRLPSDLFCVKWDVKPQFNQSIISDLVSLTCKHARVQQSATNDAAVWSQQKWAENWGGALPPFCGGQSGVSNLTQSRLG